MAWSPPGDSLTEAGVDKPRSLYSRDAHQRSHGPTTFCALIKRTKSPVPQARAEVCFDSDEARLFPLPSSDETTLRGTCNGHGSDKTTLDLGQAPATCTTKISAEESRKRTHSNSSSNSFVCWSSSSADADVPTRQQDTCSKNKGSRLNQDTEQCSLLKYDDDKWFGKAFGKSKKWRRLNYRSFVQPNFGIEDGGVFLRKCRAKAGDSQPIPAGDVRATKEEVLLVLDHIGVTQSQFLADDFVLVVKYQQGSAPTCVFSSVASAICAFGDEKAAATLAGHAQESLKHTDRMDCLNQLVREELSGWMTTGGQTGDAAAAFDCLATRSPYPTCIQICGTDGITAHCITTLGDWIFDSNETHALPLCQESLDRCAGYQINHARFYQCVKVLKLAPSKKLLTMLGKRKSTNLRGLPS